MMRLLLLMITLLVALSGHAGVDQPWKEPTDFGPGPDGPWYGSFIGIAALFALLALASWLWEKFLLVAVAAVVLLCLAHWVGF